MRYFVHVGGRRMEVEVDGGVLRVDGATLEVDLAEGRGTTVRSARVGGRSLRVVPARNGRGEWTLVVEGVTYRAEVLDPGEEAVREAAAESRADSGPSPLCAPMPGLVVRVEVEPGDLVEEGQGVVIIEAMKMENELKAPAPARVAAVRVGEGTTVERDQMLVEFEPVEEAR